MIAKNGLWYCDKCKSLLVEYESWFVEIASEHLCVCCAENEIVGLRDQLRWRKWPEEKPETGGKYLVIWFDDAKGLWLDDIKVVQCNEPLRLKLGYFYWRPIGPLPGGEP